MVPVFDLNREFVTFLEKTRPEWLKAIRAECEKEFQKFVAWRSAAAAPAPQQPKPMPRPPAPPAASEDKAVKECLETIVTEMARRRADGEVTTLVGFAEYVKAICAKHAVTGRAMLAVSQPATRDFYLRLIMEAESLEAGDELLHELKTELATKMMRESDRQELIRTLQTQQAEIRKRLSAQGL